VSFDIGGRERPFFVVVQVAASAKLGVIHDAMQVDSVASFDRSQQYVWTFEHANRLLRGRHVGP
jgi:hypothetical protein